MFGRGIALLLALAAFIAVPAPASAQQTLFFPASIPPDAPNDPLPDARAAAISESGIFVSPGDVLITNDIWMGTGHLPDITVAKPIFAGGHAS